MAKKIILGMSAYVDGKHESQVNFSLDFPGAVNEIARERNLPVVGKLLKLVSCDEMSRKREIHTDVEAFDLNYVMDCDAIFDRNGTMVPTGGILMDKALYTGAQVFNRPVSIDESKARDYMIAAMLGFPVPRTVFLPQASYVRAKMLNESSVGFDVDFDEAIRKVGGFPCFLKKANGGGKVHVYRVKNKAEFFDLYQRTAEILMVLQEGIEFEKNKYVRTFCFGERVIHTNYDLDKPDGQKYSWPQDLSDEERNYLDKIIILLARELGTPFCTMEIVKSSKDGRWYFIDITNGCNFDMREGELSTPIFQVAKTILLDELLERTLTPHPMLVHTHMQEYVLRQQLLRAYYKGQNPEKLLQFAKNNNFVVSGNSFEEEFHHWKNKYANQHGE